MSWFGFAIMAPIAIKQQCALADAREIEILAMPPDAQEKAREQDKAQREAYFAHCRALEVATAGRPKNWLETLFGI